MNGYTAGGVSFIVTGLAKHVMPSNPWRAECAPVAKPCSYLYLFQNTCPCSVMTYGLPRILVAENAREIFIDSPTELSCDMREPSVMKFDGWAW